MGKKHRLHIRMKTRESQTVFQTLFAAEPNFKCSRPSVLSSFFVTSNVPSSHQIFLLIINVLLAVHRMASKFSSFEKNDTVKTSKQRSLDSKFYIEKNTLKLFC